MIKVDLEQGSDAWFAEKIGKPSASCASKILTNSKDKDGQYKRSKTRGKYLYDLAGQIVAGRYPSGYKSAYMKEGNDNENDTRSMYELARNVDVEQVGMCYENEEKKALFSPDGLCPDRGVELKTVIPGTQAQRLDEGILPPEYFAQIQFSFMLSPFKMWDFVSHCEDMKPLIITVPRDEEFIAAMRFELDLFIAELDALVKKIR